ncbi:hypothetical protein HYPSUDRAFT_32913 [Hypholoma sublateritium FD-334 SS-4]|uniref:Zn(2)-C6 fungal-type domain-containing protein n=1 Tax=Hypholoma sublateritium (strain FD-334 SS-4) TaxID=945553 RepID=A0A0D2PFB9_HYPSF|nr:hypothetical protein HYPSUDRAFT_32913 [Hypholoma sublateritium FD-334 SS-4]
MSSSEATISKKKKPGESTPAPEGDHRKRRRNRTTQSCLNCHTSKRMCDRKRPACARCTQLGLTGLCVYEVDDPTQQTDTQDESTRLLKRVAELEGVIRELRNNPHPRWVRSINTGGESRKWNAHGSNDGSCSSNAPSPPVSSSPSDKGDSRSPFSPGSPLGESSPGLLTPPDESSLSPIGIANHAPIPDYDFASEIFSSYPGVTGVNDSTFPLLHDHRCGKQIGHCGCIHDSTNYKNMLELSVRLRKASDVLNRTPTHQLGGNFCPLHQRISELDSFTMNVLSGISESPLSDGIHPSVPSMQSYHHLQMFSQQMASGSRGPITNNRPWDIMSSNSSGSPTLDDPLALMAWDPQRRPQFYP